MVTAARSAAGSRTVAAQRTAQHHIRADAGEAACTKPNTHPSALVARLDLVQVWLGWQRDGLKADSILSDKEAVSQAS